MSDSKRREEMEHATLNGAVIEYEVRGAGEPLVLIHGAILADAFFPLLHEPAIASHYRVISYHRRGFAGSDRAHHPFLIPQQAADCRALLQHLDIPRAHVAGHSYGAITALQLALDAPDAIQSLALLEPVVLDAIPSGPAFSEGLAPIIGMYERGEKEGALDGFLTAVVGAEYRQVIDTVLPPGALDLAVADLDTFFQVELPAMEAWRFTHADAQRIHHPVVSVLGSETAPIFSETHALLKQWLPQTEELVIPQATHGLQTMNPRAVAEGLARFFAKHPL
jgi:pimeloyl-ACP methyl ester carboxylesterase